MILTNEEIMQINQTAEFDSALGYARKIEQAVLESYKAELLKEAGDPVLYAEFAEDGGWLGDASEYQDHLEEPHALYTSDQVAAAIGKLRDQLTKAEQLWQVAQGRCDGLEEKLAKAEQRVAEACAYLAHQHMDADIAADAINNGEWRKLVKEV